VPWATVEKYHCHVAEVMNQTTYCPMVKAVQMHADALLMNSRRGTKAGRIRPVVAPRITRRSRSRDRTRDNAGHHGAVAPTNWKATVPVATLTFLAGLITVAPDQYLTSRIVRLGAIAVLGATVLLWLRTAREGHLVASMRRQAHTDELTGLVNRRSMLEHLQARIQTGRPLALLLIDLDRFKEVNDSMGHAMGDELLRRIRPRLESVMRPGDIASRLGGDEFALVLDDVSDPSMARHVAERIRSVIMDPFVLAETDVLIDASVGISLYPNHGDDHTKLLRLADIAMYEAKRSRVGVCEYRSGLEQLSNQRLAMANDLREALRRSQLTVHFQPKIDLRTGQPVGAEALVRWLHPERGNVPPDEFLPIAVDTGQAAQLTSAVIELALAGVSDWIAHGLDLRVAINLYESDLRNDVIVAKIASALDRHVLPPSCLTVEITEQSLVTDPVGARRVLNQLHDLGVSISLDDYGTGYSSLAYLREFPIDELKLDKLFAQQMISDQTSWVIVRSTIELAHALGIRVVAEGVEDGVTYDDLLTLGCDIGQGFYWSAPMTATQFRRWVRSRDTLSILRSTEIETSPNPALQLQLLTAPVL
jgi:diguanylate cyclase